MHIYIIVQQNKVHKNCFQLHINTLYIYMLSLLTNIIKILNLLSTLTMKVKQEALKKTIRVGQKAGSHKCIFCIASRIGLKKVTGELIQCEPLLIAHVLHARASTQRPPRGVFGGFTPVFFFCFFFNKKLKPPETPNLIFISPFHECLFFLLRSLFFVFP